MPVVRNYNYEDLPTWTELKMFRKICFHQKESIQVNEDYPSLAFTVLCGACEVNDKGKVTVVNQYETYKTTSKEFTVKGIFKPPFFFIRNVDILLIGGEWKDADINLFMVNNSDIPKNESALGAGTPCYYYRNTNFDNHYHDFDEFWIICEGSGVVQDNGDFYEVKEGDCVATGNGNHHDFPIAHSLVKALAIEIAPEGDARQGHLWEPIHGKASGNPDKA